LEKPLRFGEEHRCLTDSAWSQQNLEVAWGDGTEVAPILIQPVVFEPVESKTSPPSNVREALLKVRAADDGLGCNFTGFDLYHQPALADIAASSEGFNGCG
jgi:hypothetical protein